MNHKKFLILFSSSRVSFWKSWMFGKYKKLILQPQLPDSAAKLILGVKWLTNTRNWTLKLKSSTSTLWHLALGVKWATPNILPLTPTNSHWLLLTPTDSYWLPLTPTTPNLIKSDFITSIIIQHPLAPTVTHFYTHLYQHNKIHPLTPTTPNLDFLRSAIIQHPTLI